jgi:drug/metabolite transporter (DMT)-like permease
MPYDYNHPLAIEPRFRHAAIAGLCFAGAFCVVCGALAIATAGGIFGNTKDVPMLGLMSLGGAVLFVLQLVLNRLFLRLPPKAKND